MNPTALVLALAGTSLAFNVFSDLYERPAYKVIFVDPLSPRSDYLPADALPYVPSSLVDDIIPGPDEALEIMVSGNTSYVCQIPLVDRADNVAHNQSMSPRDLDRVGARAQELLQPLANSCLYFPYGYWMYVMCFDRHVQQFHPSLPQLGRPPVVEDGTPLYLLGVFENTTELASVGSDNGVNYYSQQFINGSTCDLTGEPRSVELKFFCDPAATADRVAWVREIKICRYEMAIYTPKLCSDVAFLPRADDDLNNHVVCRQILDEDQLDGIKLEQQPDSLLQLLLLDSSDSAADSNGLTDSTDSTDSDSDSTGSPDSGTQPLSGVPDTKPDHPEITIAAASLTEMEDQLSLIMAQISEQINAGVDAFTLVLNTDAGEALEFPLDLAGRPDAVLFRINVHLQTQNSPEDIMEVAVVLRLQDGVLMADLITPYANLDLVFN